MLEIEKKLVTFTLEPPKAKIYQYKGKRYAVRLEPQFIRSLNIIAKKYNLKANRLIHILKEKNENINFSSYLRSFIVSEMEQIAQQGLLSKDLNTQYTILDNAPIPCLHISEDQTIHYVNDSFEKWSQTSPSLLKEKKLNECFHIKDNQSIRELINRIKFGHQTSAIISVSFEKYSNNIPISLEAKATFIPLINQDNQMISFIIWLQTSDYKRPPRILKIQKPQT